MARMRIQATRRKRLYHHGDLRNALLAAAPDLVARHGVEGFSLREAARAVGVSSAAAYRHFEDRSALLRALAHQGLAGLAQRMEEALAAMPPSPDPAERAVAGFVRLGSVYVEFAVADPARFRVMFGPWCDLADPIAPELLPLGRDPLRLLQDALDGLVRAGAIAAATRAGAEIVAWSAVHGLASLLVEGGLLTAGDRDGAFARVMRALLAGLGVSPALLERAGIRGGPPDGLSASRPRTERAGTRTAARRATATGRRSAGRRA